MLTIEELAASAKGCGQVVFSNALTKAVHAQPDLIRNSERVRWMPDEDAEQDRMCLDELLRRGYEVYYAPDGHSHELAPSSILMNDKGGYPKGTVCMIEQCPPSEFAAKALAKVVRENSDD